jgi:UDP-N-acetylmuramoyl-tripeptide--D-alanyl-D-alanine ligase
MKTLLYKLQLCGYKNGDFLRFAHKKTNGSVKWTPRAKRIYAAAVALAVLGVGLPLLFPAQTVAFANLILSPLERAIKSKWLKRAIRKLNSPAFADLIKIGITGSYGKTTCKNILSAILATQYRVVASRDSFNTPMGFARTVNEDLTPDTQILVMEMGARHRGDIAEMCGLLKPDYGVITEIGAQHLETFGSLENIRATKMELCDFVEPENTVIYDGGEAAEVQTKLLGRHNQKNIALCIKMAKKLGITDENIAKAVADLRPVPHRLELITGANGVQIIDDSYNSNPSGAKNALEILSSFNGAKVVQTCGFVEQGYNAYKSNYELGQQIAKVADFVIIMGGLNKTAIYEGLMSASFHDEKIFLAPDLAAAKAIYPQILHSGDALLIENDLPENY